MWKRSMLMLVVLVVLAFPLTTASSASPALDYVVEPLEPDFMTVEELMYYQKQLRPGDVLSMGDTSRFSTYFVPDVWKHSVVYLGTREQTREAFGEYSSLFRELDKYYSEGFEILVVDSSEVGVSIREYNIFGIYKMAAYRPLLDEEDMYIFVDHVVDKTGRGYDFFFQLNNGDYYCSELIYEGLEGVGFDIPRREVLGFREVVSPDDLLRYFYEEDDFEFLFFVDKNVEELIERNEEGLFDGPEKPLVEAYKELIQDRNIIPLTFFVLIAFIIKKVFLNESKKKMGGLIRN